MRISDWSSDVCSSDLSGPCRHLPFVVAGRQVVPVLRARRASAGLREELPALRPLLFRQPVPPVIRVGRIGVQDDAGPGAAAGPGARVYRNSDAYGKRVSVRVDLGGCLIIKKKK